MLALGFFEGGVLRLIKSKGLFGLILLVALVILPLQLNELWTERVADWIPLTIAVLGLNLLTGYSGQISLGHGAIYGLGAYVAAISVNHGTSFLLAVCIAGGVSGVFGFIISLPALRIKGLYLGLATFTFAMTFPQILEQLSKITGGSSGLAITSMQVYRGRLREKPIRFEAPVWSNLANDQWKYYTFLFGGLIIFLACRSLTSGRIGRALVAIRENEIVAEVNGISVVAVKISVFILSSALAGIGGGLFALSNARVSSGSFTVSVSLFMLVVVVIGGTGSIVGSLIGGVAYGILQDLITPNLSESIQALTPLFLGLVLIGLLYLSPKGVSGIGTKISKLIKSRSVKIAVP